MAIFPGVAVFVMPAVLSMLVLGSGHAKVNLNDENAASLELLQTAVAIVSQDEKLVQENKTLWQDTAGFTGDYKGNRSEEPLGWAWAVAHPPHGWVHHHPRNFHWRVGPLLGDCVVMLDGGPRRTEGKIVDCERCVPNDRNCYTTNRMCRSVKVQYMENLQQQPYEEWYNPDDLIECQNRCNYQGCWNYMIGDGQCDSVCNNQACGYDAGDCTTTTTTAAEASKEEERDGGSGGRGGKGK